MSPQHRARRSVALTWARPASSRWELQVDALIFIPPPVGVHGGTDSGRLTLAGSRQTDQQLRVQTNPRPPSFFLFGFFSEACFVSFPGNGSPEVSLRTVRVWSRRGKTQQGDASNGEKLESTRLNPTSSTRYLTLVDWTQTLLLYSLMFVSPALGGVPKY